MIIRQFDFMGRIFMPAEDNPPLVVHADAVPTRQPAFERLKSVRRGDAQVIDVRRVVQLVQLAPKHGMQCLGNPAPTPARTREVEGIEDLYITIPDVLYVNDMRAESGSPNP